MNKNNCSGWWTRGFGIGAISLPQQLENDKTI